MALVAIVLKSLWSRRAVVMLTVLSIAVSVALLLGVERIRQAAHDGFANTISGADLIVGARTGPLNLLLYAVFHRGDASNNVSWATYRKLADQRSVAWSIPISLGDSHRGFRVMGTNDDFFRFYRYGERRPLAFAAGGPFKDRFDAVLGAAAARKLGYRVGDKLVIAHGVGSVSFEQHSAHPFTVAGVLRPTGGPVDQTVHVSLAGIAAIHGAEEPGAARPQDADAFSPTSLTAFILGLRSRSTVFHAQRVINGYRVEPLTAIVPGVALQELWETVGAAETALIGVSAMVVFAGLLGMTTAVLTSLNERRREMAVMRAVGARAAHVFLMLMIEVLAVAAMGALLGVLILDLALLFAGPLLADRLGIAIAPAAPGRLEAMVVLGVIAAASILGLVPAARAYRNSLADGLVPRL